MSACEFNGTLNQYLCIFNLSRVMRKLEFCLWVIKDTNQLCSNCTAGQFESDQVRHPEDGFFGVKAHFMSSVPLISIIACHGGKQMSQNQKNWCVCGGGVLKL